MSIVGSLEGHWPNAHYVVGPTLFMSLTCIRSPSLQLAHFLAEPRNHLRSFLCLLFPFTSKPLANHPKFILTSSSWLTMASTTSACMSLSKQAPRIEAQNISQISSPSPQATERMKSHFRKGSLWCLLSHSQLRLYGVELPLHADALKSLNPQSKDIIADSLMTLLRAIHSTL